MTCLTILQCSDTKLNINHFIFKCAQSFSFRYNKGFGTHATYNIALNFKRILEKIPKRTLGLHLNIK